MAHFNSLIEKVNKATANWDHAKTLRAGKATLINSTLMAIPSYYLYVYHVPDSALYKISQVARKFF